MKIHFDFIDAESIYYQMASIVIDGEFIVVADEFDSLKAIKEVNYL